MSPQPEESHTPQTGRRVGHYQILEQIGKGGMGEVYRARDERLSRDVAIKVLPERLANDENARKRFVRETRVACQVIHPYVATVFDVVQEGTELFLVMERIEGRRLSGVLRESNPELSLAVDWGVEIAEGLNAIHKAGLVHRDLKPGNVMITPDGHVKLMDFGLARQSEPVTLADGELTYDGTITAEGAGVGTVLYMSPEQIRGERVDSRSDLFSFGTMLYEAITGEHPFKRGTLLESASAILNEPPGGGSEPDSLTDSGPMRSVVLKLLEKEPDRRYASSEQLLSELREVSEAGVRVAPPAEAGRRLGSVFATLALAGALLAAGLWWLNRPPVWDKPRYSIAVAPFADKTGEEDGTLRAGLLADALVSDLESSRLIRAVGPGRTSPLVAALAPDAGSVELARYIARGTAVDYVLVATLYREDGQYVATAELVSPDDDLPAPQALRVSGNRALVVAERLASGIRRALPDVSTLTAWKDDRIDIETLTSDSEEARLLFQRAEIARRDRRLSEAVEMYEGAVAADPDFVLAHLGLAGILADLGYGRSARESAAEALRLAPDPDSRAIERLALIVKAEWSLIYNRTGEAVEATTRLATLFPDEPAMLARHAAALSDAGEYENAATQIAAALERDPAATSWFILQADILTRWGHGEKALEALAEADRLAELVRSKEGSATVAMQRGATYLQMERFADAKAELREAAELFDQAGHESLAGGAQLEISKIAVLQGDLETSAEGIAATVEIARRAGDSRLLYEAVSLRGAQHLQAGNVTAAEVDLRSAVDLARQLENDFSLIHPLGNLASLLSTVGRLEEASTAAAETIDVARRLENRQLEINALQTLGDVDFQLGKLDAALETYTEILGDDSTRELDRVEAWVELYRAEVFEQRGLLERALQSTGRALETFERLEAEVGKGYGLSRQAQLLTAVGRHDRARDELTRAQAIAADSLEDLAARNSVVEAMIRGNTGDWEGAISSARQALALQPVPTVAAAAAIQACRAWTALGEHSDAVARCRAAVDDPLAPLSDRLAAKALLATALAQSGRFEEARESAEAVFDEAGLINQLIPIVQSSTVLLTLPEESRPDDLAVIRQKGQKALEDFLSSVPKGDRASTESRGEISELVKSLRGA